MPKSVLPMYQVMNSIAGQFQNLKQYREYVVANNLVAQGFPMNPYNYPQYPGVDRFLGNPIGTFYLWKIKDAKQRQIWKLAQAKIIEDHKENNTNAKLSIVEIYKQLMEHNVSTQTLKSFVNDVNPSMDEMRELMNLIMEQSNRNNVVLT